MNSFYKGMSVVKWCGGKTQILEHIINRIPKNIDTYYEPFLGGASVLLRVLQDIKPQRAVVSDINLELISMYKNIQKNPQHLIHVLQEMLKFGNTEQKYYELRDVFNNTKDKSTIYASSMFMILNKMCFRGIYRINQQGKFNVPFGNNKSISIDFGDINNMSQIIQKVDFRCCKFQDILSQEFQPNDFIYTDPPYLPITKTSFVGYTTDKFSIETSIELFNLLKRTNTKFLLSNADVPLIREHFSEFAIDVILCKRAINPKHPGSKCNEVLVYKK